MRPLLPSIAVEELRRLRHEAESAGWTSKTQPFVTWHALVRSVLVRALGEDHNLIKRFDRVRFSSGVYYHGQPASDHQRAFEGGMSNALGLLNAGLRELELIHEHNLLVAPPIDVATPPSIFYSTVYGQAAIGSTNVHQVQVNRGDEAALFAALSGAGVDADSLEDFKKALAEDREDNGGEHPSEPGNKVSTWWTRWRLRGAAAAGAVATGAAGELIAQALGGFFGMS